MNKEEQGKEWISEGSFRMKTLKIYVISSHVDKPIEEKMINSKYEVRIQAGAALTDRRICEVNDHDNFPESLSDRNRRLCEGTAVWWVANHLDTDYVGLEHYRRKFDLSDDQLESLLKEDVDIITTKPMELEDTMSRAYALYHYGGDWVFMMNLLKQHDPDHYDFYEKEAEKRSFHFGNINIMKKEIFSEYCQWLFPILDDFYRQSPEKTDRYNCRDAAFIMERLTHFFVRRKAEEKKKLIEAEIRNYSKKNWEPADECDVSDPEAVYKTCVRLYDEHNITKCNLLLGEALKHGGEEDRRLSELSDILYVGIYERMRMQSCMHDYLPVEMRKDLKTLCDSYKQLLQIMDLYAQNPTEEMKQLVLNYIGATGFSNVLTDYIIQQKETGSAAE